MNTIISEPYYKRYYFSWFSFASLLKILFYIGAIATAFFIVYSIPNFYLSSYTIVNTVQITPTYQYAIVIETDSNIISFSNFSNQLNSQLSFDLEFISSLNSPMTHLNFKFPKNGTKIQKVSVVTGWKHGNIKSVVSATTEGYDLSLVGFSGVLQLNSAQSTTFSGYSNDDLFGNNNQDIVATMQQSYKQARYLKYRYNALPINYKSPELSLSMIISYSGFDYSEQNVSVLGQLVFSWYQFFPLFLILLWILRTAFFFMLRQRIVLSELKHDAQWAEMVNKQRKRLKYLKGHA